jgi:hypothetical protein
VRSAHARVTALPALAAFGERCAQTVWVLDHVDDLDADFLAVYGIDLDTYPISGPRYLALAYRTAAYQGVMAGRVDRERQGRLPAGAEESAPMVRRPAGEVSMAEFRFKFPGLVSEATSG